MNHYVFSKGKWRSCNNPIPSDHYKTWEEAAETVGLHSKPCDIFGHPEGLYIRLYALQLGKIFSTNPTINWVITVNMRPYAQHYYCTDAEECLKKLEQLTNISTNGLLTIELNMARRRREAVELEILEKEEAGKDRRTTRRTPGPKTRSKRQSARPE